MNRRRFVQHSLAAGGLALGGGALWYGRRSYARSELTKQLLQDALPPLTEQNFREIQSCTTRARGAIKLHFHRACLNVEGFVSHICSPAFAERLGACLTEKAREQEFLTSFFERVSPPGQLLNAVETVAAELGQELNADWDGYCRRLATQWGQQVRRSSGFDEAALSRRLDGFVQAELDETVRAAAQGGRMLAVGTTLGRIGQSALLLLPLMPLGQAGAIVGVPIFVVLAVRTVWEYVASRLEDRRAGYQAAISGRIALLGNRVGNEFEQEVRRQLTDLHTWQERSVRTTAGLLVDERIGWFS